MTKPDNNLLRATNLRKYFPVKKGLLQKAREFVHAVEDVSFALGERETIGLVGESGCGKTTLGRLIIRLEKPTAGSLFYRDSSDLALMDENQFLPYRRKIQMIFQDPFSSLNPRMTVGDIIGEALIIHRLAKRKAKWDRIRELLTAVGLEARHSELFPHEFSGGQRQRISIARALAVEPEIIIADEPVSSLDVSIQAQIINLLHDLQEKLVLSFIFISHDLSVVGHISHRVAVMYLGRIVEMGTRDHIFQSPLHPYTQAILLAVPTLDPKSRTKRIILEGDVPSPIAPPPGCPFHPRCPRRLESCSAIIPEMKDLGDGHYVACHLYNPNNA